MPFRHSHLISLFIASLACSSCVTQRATNQTDVAASLAPDNWSVSVATSETINNWIATFSDPVLEKLVQEGYEQNFGLEASEQRLNAAAAAARISGATRYPNLGLDLSSSRRKNLVNFSPPTGNTSSNHSLSLSSQWELDVWQRVGKGHAAAVARFEASRYDTEALKLSLAGQIAKAWFSAIEAQAQYELATATAKSSETNLANLEKRYKRGLLEAFDLRLTRAQAASTRTNAVNRRSQMDARIRNLETLLARYPSAELKTASELPDLSATPPASLPSTLLQRRPDLLAAERRLAAFFTQNEVTQRNWLPRISLTGSTGTVSNQFSDLIDTDFNIWSLAGSLSTTLFHAGRLKAERDQSEANYLSQVAQYKNAALQAFREVEIALRSEQDLNELEESAQIAATESLKAEEQSWSLYERGLVNINSVLTSERRSLTARSQLLSIKNQRLQNRVDLHIALGGGFEE